MYSSAKEHPTVIRIRIRMRDLIDPDCMRYAVDTTMKRYPYFCVELNTREDNRWEYLDNSRPVVITNSLCGVELNSEASNYHLIAFSWQDNWIVMDVSHAMTDGTARMRSSAPSCTITAHSGIMLRYPNRAFALRAMRSLSRNGKTPW